MATPPLNAHVITTRFSSISRSTGQDIGARTAYVMGVNLRNRAGEWFCHQSRTDIIYRTSAGWHPDSGEPQEVDLQRFVDQAQALETRSNAREGNSLIISLPGDPPGATEAEKQGMAQVRRKLVHRTASWLHRQTGCAVLAAAHSPPDGGALQYHGHFILSRRRMKEGVLGPEDIEVFTRKNETRRLLKRLRRRLERQYNRVLIGFGTSRPWTAMGHSERFRRINASREKLGLEPLEALRPTRHEGPAVFALRRQKRVGDLDVVIRNDVALENDRLREDNRAIRERNVRRIECDAITLSLHRALAAREVLSRLFQDRGDTNGGIRALTEREAAELERVRSHLLSDAEIRERLEMLSAEARHILTTRYSMLKEQDASLNPVPGDTVSPVPEVKRDHGIRRERDR